MYNSLFPNNKYRAPFSRSTQQEREEATKAARKNRGASKPEMIELAILPNFYYSHGEWKFGFVKHHYLFTTTMADKRERCQSIEALLTLYNTLKYLAVLKADTNNEDSIKKSTQTYNEYFSGLEREISVHKNVAAPSRDIDLFKNQMVNSLSLLIENLDKYAPIMSEDNQKLAEKYKSELSKYQQLIKSGKFDLTKYHKLAYKTMYELEEKDSSNVGDPVAVQ